MSHPSLTDKQKEDFYSKYNSKCLDCEMNLNGYWHLGGFPNAPKMTFTIENGHLHHSTPIYRGGKHNKENIILLCIPCHLERHKILAKEDTKVFRETGAVYFRGQLL